MVGSAWVGAAGVEAAGIGAAVAIGPGEDEQPLASIAKAAPRYSRLVRLQKDGLGCTGADGSTGLGDDIGFSNIEKSYIAWEPVSRKPVVPKSIHRPEYAALLELVREARRRAGITQVDLSNRLGRPQSFVSDIERGSRRLDLVELRDVCHLLGCDLPGFVASFEDALEHQRQSKTAIPRKRARKPVR